MLLADPIKLGDDHICPDLQRLGLQFHPLTKVVEEIGHEGRCGNLLAVPPGLLCRVVQHG